MNKPKCYQIISERIDDIVLLLNMMKQIGLPELINQHLPRHWKEKGLDWLGGSNHLAILYSVSRRPSQGKSERMGQAKKRLR
jgi:transposase